MVTKGKRKKQDQARLAAVRVLYQVLEEGAFSNESAAYHLSGPGLDARDRAFASALIFGSLANLARIDYDLTQVSSRPPDKLDPWVRTILRMGVWQLFYSYQVTTAAACDESVHLARFLVGEKVTGFVNGIMRHLARQRPVLEGPDSQAIEAGLSPQLFGLLSAWYGPEAALALGEWSLQTPASVTIRANASRMEAFDKWSLSQEAGDLALEKRPWPPMAYSLVPSGNDLAATRAYRQGLYSLQSRAAMLVGHLSAVQPQDRILDLCAAPGGKSGHLAELTGCQGSILASDLSPQRLALIDAMTERLGQACIKTLVQDATKRRAEWETAFDLVLCDVPCSGLGLLQKRPEIRWRVSPESIDRLLAIQGTILERAASYVVPAGHLLYTTCTINPRENEEQVEAFLASEAGRDFELCDLTGELETLLKGDLPAPMSSRLPACLCLLPHRDGTDGFFIARMRRQG